MGVKFRDLVNATMTPEQIERAAARTEELAAQPVCFLTIGDDRVWCVACKSWKCTEGDSSCPDDGTVDVCPIQEGDSSKWLAVTVEQAQEAIDALAKELKEAYDVYGRQPRITDAP